MLDTAYNFSQCLVPDDAKLWIVMELLTNCIAMVTATAARK